MIPSAPFWIAANLKYDGSLTSLFFNFLIGDPGLDGQPGIPGENGQPGSPGLAENYDVSTQKIYFISKLTQHE